MNIEKLYELFLKYPIISTDTRIDIRGSLFFCLKGENHDGNSFARAAIDAGAAFAIIDNPSFSMGHRTVLVENSLTALQQLALVHRNLLRIPVIGITGTNGKTTTKELIHAVLSKKFRVSATRGNLNNHIGVPLTLLSIKPETEIAIVEMGANHPGEIAELCLLAKPDFGMITNIGRAHLEGFGSLENIVETKTALYKSVADSMGKLFVNADDPILMSKAKGNDSFLYGNNEDNFCPGQLTGADPYVTLEWGKSFRNKLQTRLIGSYNLENILAAICIGMFFGIPEQDINDALANYQPSNMRSQLKKTSCNTVILDAYNANPTSMKAAIVNFVDLTSTNKIAILGDMLELGENKESDHLEILENISSKGFDKVILIGPVFSKVNPYKEFLSFQNSLDAMQYLKKNPLKDATILLKGSRGISLEKVLEAL
jgi:UDP-N-acetylmuramoyl-tripeptide--D-alanyl-D-alanine ligase